MEHLTFISSHWAELLLGLLAFVKIVVNLTPTTTDNSVFEYFDILITAITGDRRKKKK
jgi:uncharacterized membrane protein